MLCSTPWSGVSGYIVYTWIQQSLVICTNISLLKWMNFVAAISSGGNLVCFSMANVIHKVTPEEYIRRWIFVGQVHEVGVKKMNLVFEIYHRYNCPQYHNAWSQIEMSCMSSLLLVLIDEKILSRLGPMTNLAWCRIDSKPLSSTFSIDDPVYLYIYALLGPINWYWNKT